MLIAIPRELTPGETRVAIVPAVVKKYRAWGLPVRVESGAGLKAGFSDEDYREADAEIISGAASLYKNADIILKIWAPLPEEDSLLSKGSAVIANFQALGSPERVKKLAGLGLTCFALDLLPRISRAQSMDILSSQSNLAGYKAVIEAVNHYHSAVPLMMTAAGTVTPARVLILGAGVAGLQAIATAKRLGAQVYASDVRPAVKEQVESLGAKFVEVNAEAGFETSGAYASETSDEYKKAQELAVAEQLTKTDIAITTALIPGRPAPKLIKRCMLDRMPRGAVIIDMASAFGGNIDGSVDRSTVEIDGVKIIGNSNLAAGVPHSASLLFANNLYNFLAPNYHSQTHTFAFNYEDELVKAVCIARGGKVLMKE